MKTRRSSAYRGAPPVVPIDHALRHDIAELLAIHPEQIREWNTRFCPDCRKDTVKVPVCAANGNDHLPILYYALAPEQANGDMPMGMGDTGIAALRDLLDTIRLDHLLDAMAADQ